MRAALVTTAAVLLLLATWAHLRGTSWRAAQPQGEPASHDAGLPPVSAPPDVAAPGVETTYQTAALPPSERRHVVAAGDTLESISRHYYGDDSHATEIYEANRDQIRDPATLHAGQTLVLP